MQKTYNIEQRIQSLTNALTEDLHSESPGWFGDPLLFFIVSANRAKKDILEQGGSPSVLVKVLEDILEQFEPVTIQEKIKAPSVRVEGPVSKEKVVSKGVDGSLDIHGFKLGTKVYLDEYVQKDLLIAPKVEVVIVPKQAKLTKLSEPDPAIVFDTVGMPGFDSYKPRFEKNDLNPALPDSENEVTVPDEASEAVLNIRESTSSDLDLTKLSGFPPESLFHLSEEKESAESILTPRYKGALSEKKRDLRIEGEMLNDFYPVKGLPLLETDYLAKTAAVTVSPDGGYALTVVTEDGDGVHIFENKEVRRIAQLASTITKKGLEDLQYSAVPKTHKRQLSDAIQNGTNRLLNWVQQAGIKRLLVTAPQRVFKTGATADLIHELQIRNISKTIVDKKLDLELQNLQETNHTRKVSFLKSRYPNPYYLSLAKGKLELPEGSNLTDARLKDANQGYNLLRVYDPSFQLKEGVTEVQALKLFQGEVVG